MRAPIAALAGVAACVALAAGPVDAPEAQVAVLGPPHLFLSERIDPDGPAPVAQVQAELLVPASAVTAHVDYGPTAAYGQQTPEEPQPGRTIAVDLPALRFGVIYHYRVVVTVDGVTFAGQNATFFVPYPALHLPVRLDVQIAGRPVAGRTRVRFLRLRGVPGGTRVEVLTCVYRGEPVCARERTFFTAGASETFLRGRTFASGRGASVTAYLPDGQVVDTDVVFRAGRPPEVMSACGRGKPGETDYSEQPCVAIRTVSRTRSAGLSLRVEGAQTGMRIEVRCRGRGCPRPRVVYPVRLPIAGVGVNVVPRGYSRLRPGSIIDVLVTRPRTTGVARRITIGRRGARPGNYRCVRRDSFSAVIGCLPGLKLPFPAAPAAVQVY